MRYRLYIRHLSFQMILQKNNQHICLFQTPKLHANN